MLVVDDIVEYLSSTPRIGTKVLLVGHLVGMGRMARQKQKPGVYTYSRGNTWVHDSTVENGTLVYVVSIKQTYIFRNELWFPHRFHLLTVGRGRLSSNTGKWDRTISYKIAREGERIYIDVNKSKTSENGVFDVYSENRFLFKIVVTNGKAFGPHMDHNGRIFIDDSSISSISKDSKDSKDSTIYIS